MKRNFYDIFDHLGEDFEDLPELKREKSDAKSLTDRVFEKADIHPVQRKNRPYRLIAIAAVIAMFAGGTLTAAAVSGKMEEFFSSVSKAEISDASPEESLPAVNADLPEAVSEMERFYSCPDVSFTPSDSGTVELLGLYNDSSTMMISFRLTVTEGTSPVNDGYMLPYFSLTLPDGTEKQLSQSGYLSEPLVKSGTEENVYYMTYYLTDPEISGAVLHTEFAGAYTMEQAQNVQKKLVALDDELREQYFTEDMSIGQWKKFQNENGFEELRKKTRREAFEEETPVLSGNWQGDIQLPTAKSEPFVIETERNTYILDELSMLVSYDSDEDKYSDEADPSRETYLGSAVYLSDGTVFINEPVLRSKTDISDSARDFAFRYGASFAGSTGCDGEINCFSRPVQQSEIEKITEFRSFYDENGEEHITETLIYSK